MAKFSNLFESLNLLEEEDNESSETSSEDTKPTEKNTPQVSKKILQATRRKRERSESVSFYKPLVWIDLEMTGLDVQKDRILEIACIITDGRLEKIIEGPDLIINQPEEMLAGMNEWCREHHGASGLVEGVRTSKISEQDAETQVLDFINQHVPGKAYIAGNSVYVDLLFLKKHMPKLGKLFSHIVVDVSSVKALCYRWYPKEAEKAPEKQKNHRALDDIKESIEELKYFQTAIFKRKNPS